jgi:hypothetical protein
LSNTQLSKPAAAALSVERRKLLGPKPLFRLSHVWSMRAELQIARRGRGLALFDLAIESKLRNCDLVAVRADGGPEQLHRRPSNDSVGKRVGSS